MKKVLLVGNGAREHVIAETLKRSRHEVAIFGVGPTMNPGIVRHCDEYILVDVKDVEAIRNFALEVQPDFAILGPEAPIAAGVADMLLEIGVKSASPLQTVGRLESSKAFTRELMEKYGIKGNPAFKCFTSSEGLREFFEELGENYVVKADGLKGGKGVKVSGDHLNGIEEGVAYALECLESDGQVVIEEKLIGQEFSLMSFCDGLNTAEMPVIQDHKRAFEGDTGPNTGGMGTYSDANHLLPFITAEDVAAATEITKKMAKALFDETGCYFKGVMYGGFIAVKDGVKLIEYNARFGDPEAMNALALLETDFVDLCEAIISGELDKLDVKFSNLATVCKYLVPNGYPDAAIKGEKVFVDEDAIESLGNAKAYFASVDLQADGLYLAGSRAVAILGTGQSIEEAEKAAQKGVETVKGPVFYRKDIGTSELIEKRIAMMKEIRG